MNSGKVSPILFVILGVSLGLFGFFLLLANPFGWKTAFPSLLNQNKAVQEKTPKNTEIAPTPYLFIPHGKQTYNTRGGDSKKSKVTSITYDPLDPAVNTDQIVSATVESSEGATAVNFTLNTDNKTNTYPMKIIQGSGTRGVWTTTYKMEDTYEKIYNVSFEIITELGNKTVQPMLIR